MSADWQHVLALLGTLATITVTVTVPVTTCPWLQGVLMWCVPAGGLLATDTIRRGRGSAAPPHKSEDGACAVLTSGRPPPSSG